MTIFAFFCLLTTDVAQNYLDCATSSADAVGFSSKYDLFPASAAAEALSIEFSLNCRRLVLLYQGVMLPHGHNQRLPGVVDGCCWKDLERRFDCPANTIMLFWRFYPTTSWIMQSAVDSTTTRRQRTTLGRPVRSASLRSASYLSANSIAESLGNR
ncbi:hypothetical protein F4821DRAFT_140266 [Hypoxylon rubiginosum]|uniref:Uncharacterized protein n=1 Tax=Hypoxylon rubiginosum TaxID=110542 RepID=A0ACC0D0F7_9PEZI|nr:hypothetical protein F4821DRAFT_140266 [Hypoxylon rubiginosum]